MLSFLLATISIIVTITATSTQSSDAICNLNLPAYTGGWYELATSNFISQTIELNCMCSATFYTLNTTDSNVLDATNSCINTTNNSFTSVTGNVYSAPSNEPQGNLRAVIGSTQVMNSSQIANQTSNYVIMRLWDDEQYSLVGSNSTNIWWFLSRSPNWNDTMWQSALHLLQAYNYNVTNWKKTEQTCQFLGQHGVNLIPP